MKAMLRFVLFSWWLIFGAAAHSQDTNFWVFLCFGQSNMEGFPGIEEQDKSGIDPRFQVFATVDFPKLERKKEIGIPPCHHCADLVPVFVPPTILGGR